MGSSFSLLANIVVLSLAAFRECRDVLVGKSLDRRPRVDGSVLAGWPRPRSEEPGDTAAIARPDQWWPVFSCKRLVQKFIPRATLIGLRGLDEYPIVLRRRVRERHRLGRKLPRQ